MIIEITANKLQQMLTDAAELGALSVLTATGKLKPYLNKAQAFRLYNRNVVEFWLSEGLIASRKDGTQSACWRIDRVEAHILFRSLQHLDKV